MTHTRRKAAMSGRLAKPLFLVVALLLLAGSRSEAVQRGELRTWTDRTGKYQTQAVLLNLQNGHVRLKKEDGQIVTLAVEKLSPADQDYVKQQTGEKPAGDAVEALVRSVVAIGSGTDLEKAEQAAFAQAIEQTMGVLVDSETLVENDELVRDKILTLSRGYVDEFDVIRRWKQDGLYHVEIDAKVAVDSLHAKLKDSGITVHELTPEEREKLAKVFHQSRFDQDASQSAADIFRNAMRDYSLNRFMKVQQPIEREVVSRDGALVKLRIRVKLSADFERWEKFRTELKRILRKITRVRFPVVSPHNKCDDYCTLNTEPARSVIIPFELRNKSTEPGIWIGFLNRIDPDGQKSHQTTWELYRTTGWLAPVIAPMTEEKWELHIELLDDAGEPLAQTEHALTYSAYNTPHWCSASFLDVSTYDIGHVSAYWLGPFLWGPSWGGNAYAPYWEPDITVDLATEDLPNISKVVAFLVEIKDK